MDRRSFLGVAASAGLVALAGCTDTGPRPGPSGSATAVPLPDSDDGLREVTFAAEQQLIALYATSIAGLTGPVAVRLRELQAQHVDHAERLQPNRPIVTAAPVSDTPTASRSPGASPGPRVRATPTPRAVLANLRRAEQSAIKQRSAASDVAEGAALARDLCLIAASEAQHADVLRDLRAELE